VLAGRAGRYHDARSVTSAYSPVVPDALGLLRGTWRVERRLTDHRTGSAGWFRGTARFEPAGPDELAYHESGELAFGEHRGPASRRLIYRRRPDGTADVFFADGREFYRLDPRPGWWQARHPCGRDEYVLAGRVLGERAFEEHWRVRGPDKDYEIMTTLTRTYPDIRSDCDNRG
jgi:hypothetical protein